MLLALVFIVSAAFSPFTNPARASLGGDAASVQADQRDIGGERRELSVESAPAPGALKSARSAGASVSVQEITRDGMQVREYVLPSGQVFAVTWRGLSEPDLSKLLGGYYKEYRSAASAQPRARGRARRVLRSQNIVVEKSGRMRDVRGKAFVRSLMPEGFSSGDLQ